MKKFIFGLAIGLIISCGVGVAAYSMASKDVEYDNSTSGLTATNLQEAVDELTTLAAKGSKYKRVVISGRLNGSAQNTSSEGGRWSTASTGNRNFTITLNLVNGTYSISGNTSGSGSTSTYNPADFESQHLYVNVSASVTITGVQFYEE